MKIEGIVTKIIFRTEDDYYTVVVVVHNDGITTCVGQMPGVYEDAEVSVCGEMEETKYGNQLKVHEFEVLRPQEEYGIVQYLSCGLISGIKEYYAKKIVDTFHKETFHILDNEPERLLEISGIGKKRKDMIMESWAKNRSVSDLIVFLSMIQLSQSQAMRIIRKYGATAQDLIRENPYKLCEIEGIGFKTADRAAIALGIESDSPVRISAAITYVLEERTNAGDVFLKKDELLAYVAKLLFVNKAKIEECLPSVDLVEEDGKYYLPSMYAAEIIVAQHIRNRLENVDASMFAIPISRIESETGIHYDESQRHAIELAMNSSIMVMTGGPGTGKTVTIGGIIEAYEMSGKTIELAAPTGRAAKRMSEATLREAKTIHRLLEYGNEGFGRNKDNQLDCDVLILDECSMVDITLMKYLLDALPLKTTLIMVGDVDQLPSVGPGKILDDMIRCGGIPVVKLEYIHRQGDGLIVENAHHVNDGEALVITNQKDSDFFFAVKNDENDILESILKTVSGFHDFTPDDIQVLAPKKKGIVGTIHLNEVLREKLNPPSVWKHEIRTKETLFRVGDRVMQMKNNYDKNVFNGDVGKITEIDTEFKTLTVQFQDRECEYDRSEMIQLIHAYAVTVHKSQGSEYPCVIMPIVKSQSIMLTRKLLYTAITRAKKMFVLIGQTDAVERAVKTNREDARNTYLAERICEPINV